MRPASFMVFALVLGSAACGGARRTPATTASATVTAEPTEPAVVAERPCSTWDPAADPSTVPLDVAAPPETSRDGGDGLRFCILRQGTARVRPTRDSHVRVHYTGWTTDGEMFDSSRTGEPARFGVTEVIPGWTNSLLHMTVGQVRRVWVPESLAYEGAPGMPAGMLVFDIELVAIE